MTAWIECNLPYGNCRFVDDDKLPPEPDMSEAERAKFGTSCKELCDEAKFTTLNDLFLEIPWNLTKAATRKEKTHIAKEAGMANVLKAQRKIVVIKKWRETLPEYVAWSAVRKAEYDRLAAELETACFDGQGLNKPGTQIEVGEKLYLIGDINPNRGVCDDCIAFASDAIVTRYRVLVDLKEPDS